MDEWTFVPRWQLITILVGLFALVPDGLPSVVPAVVFSLWLLRRVARWVMAQPVYEIRR